ncbi:MAG: TetR/AcrR family transcriptional regulator [Cohaesibacter sp.]|nr:TetR/AcrR family transcriptional regulator [Cohaesibacter sp.]
MARPREFKMQDALHGAMDIFWVQGYAATNLPDLLKAMGITRGSFYKAFVDKRSVYLAALDFYDQNVVSGAVTLLQNANEPTLTANLMLLFGGSQEEEPQPPAPTDPQTPQEQQEQSDQAQTDQTQTDQIQRGCFICNAMIEVAPTDSDVAQRTNAMADRLYRAIYQQIDKHLPHMTTAAKEDRAQAVLHLYFGAQAMGKAGRQPHKWQNMLADILA